MGWACTMLHERYLKRFHDEKHLHPGFSARYQRQHFLKPSRQFLATFEDLFLLYRLDKLDVSLLRCWTLFMIQEARKANPRIGFLDPQVVCGNTIRWSPGEVETYIAESMVALYGSNDLVLLPYNYGDHWILVCIYTHNQHCIYMDSMFYNKDRYSDLIDMLNRSFAKYFSMGGIVRDNKPSAAHQHKFPCHRQPQGTIVCGFYVAHYMLQIVVSSPSVYPPTYKFPTCSFSNDGLMYIQKRLAIFIIAEILKDTDEFMVSKTLFRQNNEE